jgi:hypothetical protein
MADILKDNDKTIKLQKELNARKRELEIEIELSSKKIDNIYRDRLDGVIDLEMYKRLTNEITETTITKKNEIKEIDAKIYNIKNKIVDSSKKYDSIIKEYLSMKKPSIQLLTSIIDKIVIDERQTIDIYYKFRPFENGY